MNESGLDGGLSNLCFMDENGQVRYNPLAAALNRIDGRDLMAGVAAWRASGCARLELVQLELNRAVARLAEEKEVEIPPYDVNQLLEELAHSFL